MAKTKKRIDKRKVEDMALRFPRNITQELHDSWTVMRRHGDPLTLKKKLKKSRPIIDRALNYGNVKTDALAVAITKFFNDRFEREKEEGSKLIQKATA